jgi:cyanophycinase
MTMKKVRSLFLLGMLTGVSGFAQAATYQYIRLGNPEDVQTRTDAGTAMMGGGRDLDEAFRWLCHKGHGGDFLVLRATGGDDYNAYVNGLCKVNSVATLIIPDREAALNPQVAEIMGKAEVLFVAGGDQSNYVRAWKGTPVEEAINAHVAMGRPIGGTSAGLAVEGEFVYGCLKDTPKDKDLASNDVLPNPYFERVTLVREFLKIPHLENLLTDSHFAKRDRMGRSLSFLARIMEDGWSNSPREVAVDEKSAVLVESDGKATVWAPERARISCGPRKVPKFAKKERL